jgi:predicted Zn-ribbon and HTH transcriptional regulator
MSQVIWSGKPYMRKTAAKMLAIFILLSLIFSPLLLFPSLYFLGAVLTLLFFVAYYFSKNAFTYYLTSNSVRISKSWVFGNYDRQITFDKIQDIYVKQGIFARRFECGSLVFVTTTGLEVGYTIAGGTGGRFATPQVAESKGNKFSDIQGPANVREILMNKLADWRNVFQQQKIATSTQKMATSLERIEERSTVQPSKAGFCHMCGASTTSESSFCHKCGSKLLTE